MLAQLRKNLQNILAGGTGKDIVGVNREESVSDSLLWMPKWRVCGFDSELYDRLTQERIRVAVMLESGHRARKMGRAKIAGNHFRAALDIQDNLVNRHAFMDHAFAGNALLDEGINAMTTLICGGAETPYNNANADLGVGTGTPVALTGTATFAQNSANVIGTGTAFDTELVVGDWIRAITSPDYYRVVAINSSISVTIDRTFQTATETGFGALKLDTSLLTLPGTVTWVGMDAGYPTFGSGKSMAFQSVFGSGVANHAWEVFGVRNGAGADKNMNMKFQSEGTKTAGQTRTLTLTVDLM